jgi:hypothetical protein
MYLFRLSNNIMILGSCHDADYNALPSAMREEISAAKILVLESIKLADNNKRVAFIEKCGGFKHDQKYKITLPEALKQEVISYLSRENMPFNFDDLNMVGLGLVIYSMKKASGLDSHLENAFQGRKIYPLENICSDMDVIDYVKTIDPIGLIFSESSNTPLLAKYMAQDLDLPFLADESYAHISRNKNWGVKLVEMGLIDVQQDKTLICVGLAHLFGESGLLNFFAKRGVAIEAFDCSSNHFTNYDKVFPFPFTGSEYEKYKPDVPDQSITYDGVLTVHQNTVIQEGRNFCASSVIMKEGASTLKLDKGAIIIGPGSMVFEKLGNNGFDYTNLHDLTVKLSGEQIEIILDM